MKHSRFGLVFLLSCGGLLACNGDPTASIRDDEPPKIVADPAVVFLDQGASTFVVFELVDAQGNQLPATFDVTSAGSQATVERDTTFLATTNGGNLNTKERYSVTGGDAGVGSLTVTAGGATLDVPVNVVPTAVAATFSNAAPAANEELTVTLPSGYTFGADASVVFGAADSAVVRSIAEDGSSVTVLPLPGSTGSPALGGVQADFLPGLTLTLPTVDQVTVAAVTPLAGTDAPGTAPTFEVPAAGSSTVFFDGGTFDYQAPILGGAFGTFPSRLYKFTIPADGDYAITVDWLTPEDLGAYYFLPDGTTETGTAADNGGGGAHPETSTTTFTAGTYLVAIVNFDGTSLPFFSIKFEQVVE